MSDSNHINTIPSSTSYLVTEAHANGIPGQVLLDTESGLTIISSQHWSIIGDKIIQPIPYTGPDIHVPEGSSVCHVGWMTVNIDIAGITIQHRAILAKHFTHSILIGNDLMKNIELVLDIQANKMWLRSKPDAQYDISCDLTGAERMDVPLLSTQLTTIPLYHAAFVQVKTPFSLSTDIWEASVTGIRRHVIAANLLVRIENQCCLVQIANCSSKPQVIYPDQYLAVADLYEGDDDTCQTLTISTSYTTFASPPLSSNSINLSDESHCFAQSTITSTHHNNKSFLSTSFPPQALQISSNDSIITSDINTSTTSHLSKFLSELQFTNTDLTTSQIEALKSLLLIQHPIDTGDTKPIKLRPYRVSPARKQIISNEINKMLNTGIIEPCNDPYAAPITLQPKTDGSLKFCIDFRQLNAVTIRGVYPIPRIDDTLDQLQHAKYFTSMDLRSGFWQIELDPNSRDKTAFISHADLFRFRFMPFGLTNAPATFQSLMDLVLDGLKWSCALVYLDDIIVYSSSFIDHLSHVEFVLDKIQRSGLTLKIDKCQFCRTNLKYVGHVVSKDGIRPDPAKLAAVREYPVPTTLKAARTFLGLSSYYQRFIKNFSTIAGPLMALTRQSDSKSFRWCEACQQSFELLRLRLTEAPIISYDKPFLLQLDASDAGLSAILAQQLLDDDGIVREHVIGYANRTLNSTERKYGATERECLAIVFGCNYFRPYLEGVRFTAITLYGGFTQQKILTPD